MRLGLAAAFRQYLGTLESISSLHALMPPFDCVVPQLESVRRINAFVYQEPPYRHRIRTIQPQRLNGGASGCSLSDHHRPVP